MTVSGDVLPATSMVGSNPEMVDIFATDELVPFAIKGTPFTVMLQRELDWGEQQEIESSALRGVQRQDLEAAAASSQTLVLDLSKQRFLVMALRVRKWNVRRRNPETGEWVSVPLPTHITERIAVMRRLKPKWARLILTKIEELDQANNEAEPEMPLLMIEDEKEEAPKATNNGVTEGQVVTSQSVSS